MLHYYDLEISEVFIHENYLINQIREGMHVQPEHADLLKAVIDKHFASNSMIYISNRVNSYSVDPLTYGFVASIENLVAMAIIGYTEKSRKMAAFEKDFYKKPFQVFKTLTDAIVWTFDQLENDLPSQS